MASQTSALLYDLWSSSLGAVFAIDALGHDSAPQAWLSSCGSRIHVVHGGQAFELSPIEPSIAALARLDLAALVEFSPSGPVRETPISAAPPSSLALGLPFDGACGDNS